MMGSSIYSEQWSVFKARELPQNKILEADVVIIGSGAGGGITAEVLANKGLKVIIIEEGPYRNKKQFNMLEKEAYPDLYQESAARKTKDKAISILQGKAVGGSTTVNWTTSFKTPDQTLEHWKNQFALEGLEPGAMLPWFNQIEEQLSISPWPVPANENNQILARGMGKLGLESNVIPRNVKGCANLGYCGMGCPLDAKQSMLVTTIPSALSHGATLISRARVDKFIFTNRKISSVDVQPLLSNGKTSNAKESLDNLINIKAKHFVLSAGAIGSPAVLLRSKAPDPYSNVGKRTFLHPVTISASIMSNKVNAFSGAPQSLYSDEFLWRDGTTGEMGYKLEVPPMHPLLSSLIMPGHGKSHSLLMEKLPYIHSMLALHRDGFNDQSIGGTVELNEQGLPVLDYPLTDLFWRSAKESLLTMAEIQFAAGAKQVQPIHLDANLANNWRSAKSMIENLSMVALRLNVFSAHVMGGCSMGADEKGSVVNAYGQHHQIANLSIIDGSVFPTSLGVNPQLSIYALAKRNAVYLSEHL